MDITEILDCSPAKAQEYCNFIVFESTQLPHHLVLKEQKLRKESNEGKRSSYRQVYEGNHRTLVIKQFLYDWAPPAYDCPCLWRNAKIATKQESPPPKGVIVGNDVLWIGKNYRKQKAATIEIMRTRIEITLEKGEFSEEELIDLCKHLKPVNSDMAQDILKIPFSQLSYYARHQEKAISVPTGFWKHQRDKEMFCFPVTQDDIERVLKSYHDIRIIQLLLEKENYTLNSLFTFGFEKENPQEVEWILEHSQSPGSFIRILCTASDAKNPIVFPPVIDDQECKTKTVHTNSKNIYYARAQTFEYGPHELVFNINSYNVLLLIKPAPWTDKSWLERLINHL